MESSAEVKKCSKCGEIKGFVDFSPNKLGRYGLASRCRQCHREIYHDRRDTPTRVVTEKVCSMCKIVKHSVCFLFKKGTTDGLSSCCGECQRNHERDRYHNDDEFRSAKISCNERHKNNPEVKKATSIKRKKKYQQPEVKAKVCKQQRERNKRPEVQADRAEYVRKPEVRFNKNQKKRLRYAEDEEYRIESNLRSRMSKECKRQRVDKSEPTLKILGCTLPEFKKHMSRKFHPHPKTGELMTWQNQNYRGWHIDHVVPCSFWDLTDPIHQKLCFHYTNTQPLWARYNLKKGGSNRPRNSKYYRQEVVRIVEKYKAEQLFKQS